MQQTQGNGWEIISDRALQVDEPEKFREQFGRFVQNPLFEKIVIGLIIINPITLGLETVPSVVAKFGFALAAIDNAILSIFVGEIVIRLVHDFKGFWRDPWRIFDFTVVGIALVPASRPTVGFDHPVTASGRVEAFICTAWNGIDSLSACTDFLCVCRYPYKTLCSNLS